MKRVLALCASMALVASSAFAIGMDLSVGACGDNQGAANEATVDCANGGNVTLLGVFQPAEAYDDEANGYVLTGFDGIIDINVGGELAPTGSGAFWDWDQFGGCNPTALVPDHAPPAGAACAGYTNPWDIDYSGEGAAALRRTPSLERVAFGCFRPAGTPLITTANQRLFGITLLIDGATSLESGHGTCGGCTAPAAIYWNLCTPAVLSGEPTTPLVGSSVFGTCVGINAGSVACGVVPTKKRTWGQLKSLYR